MIAYVIIDEDADYDENAVLVFAHNEDEARRIGWNVFDREATLTITRAPQVDSMVKHEATRPYECCDEEICVAAGLRPDGEGPGHIEHWRKKTQQFIDGLLDAHSNNEDVEFY